MWLSKLFTLLVLLLSLSVPAFAQAPAFAPSVEDTPEQLDSVEILPLNAESTLFMALLHRPTKPRLYRCQVINQQVICTQPYNVDAMLQLIR